VVAVERSHDVPVERARLDEIVVGVAHPVAAAPVFGAIRPYRIAEDLAALLEDVAAAFGADLRAARLVSPAVPLPGGP
jgi:D-threo-aldose 1-dehydrogenase